jgi:hypothetical protein
MSYKVVSMQHNPLASALPDIVPLVDCYCLTQVAQSCASRHAMMGCKEVYGAYGS